MTAPDPKTVREIARKFLLDPHMTASDLKALVRDAAGADASDETFSAWYDAVRADVRKGRVETVASWPDEQQPAEATGGEQVQDGAAGRMRAWLEFSQQNRPGYDHLRDVSYTKAPICDDDLRAVLDNREVWRNLARSRGTERNALAARVAELEGERNVLAALLLAEPDEREADARAVAEVAAAEDDEALDRAISNLIARFADRIAALEADPAVVIGAGSPETSALTHCPTCGSPEWLDDGRRGWNPVDVECEVCAGTYAAEIEGS